MINDLWLRVGYGSADFWRTFWGAEDMFEVTQRAINKALKIQVKLWVEYEEIDKNAFTVIVRCDNDNNEDSE